MTFLRNFSNSNSSVVYPFGLYNGAIVGTVRANGRPKANIKVEIDSFARGNFVTDVYTFTDEAGQYRFDGLQTNMSYCLRFSDPTGIYATSYYGSISFGALCDRVAVVNSDVVTDIDHTLEQGGGIASSVKLIDGSPLKDVRVILYKRSLLDEVEDSVAYLDYTATGIETSTDENGEFRLTGILPGTYQLYFVYKFSGYKYLREYYGNAAKLVNATDIAVVLGETARIKEVIMGSNKQFLPIVSNN